MKCPEGVYLHALGGACTLKGERSYEWFSRLAPYLTGERTLNELVGSLADDQRTMVEELVRALSEQQFVIDMVGAEPHLLDAEEQRIYAAEIAFIRYGLDSAERRFQRVREARIALIGEGPVAGAVLAAGLWSGWCQIRMFAPATELDGLPDVVAAARRDPKQSVRLQPWPEEPEDRRLPAGIADEADVVLQVCGEARRADLIAVSRACAGAGTALGQVLVGDGEAWLTAVGPPGVVEAESCWRRLAGQRGTETGTAPDGGWLTGPVPSIIAAQLALSCFSQLTGLDTLPAPERAPQPPVLTRVDLGTLVTRTHRVRPHPQVSAPATEADTRALIDELACGAPVQAADLLERAAGFIDARTGLLAVLDEEDLVQVPLSVCRAIVSDPYGLLPGWAPAPTVTGWGGDRSAARLRALLAALATYGTLCPGPVSDQQWGLDLVTGRLRGVPATVAYPVLRGAALPYRAPVGAAAGRCWTDAVAAGLRAHCEALLAGHSDNGAPGVRDLDEVVAGIADEQATQLLRLVRAADQRISLTDLSGVLELPAFEFRTGTDPVVLSCAATKAEAVRDGLERVVLRWQARTAGQAPPRTSTIPWPVELSAPQSGGPHDDPRCRVLTEALCRAGWVPVAVPITQDRQARGLLAAVVHVVLCDD